MRRYIIYVNSSRINEFETLFLNKKYIKDFSKTKNMDEDCIYILTVRDSSIHIANFYNDLKNAKDSEIIHFGWYF